MNEDAWWLLGILIVYGSLIALMTRFRVEHVLGKRSLRERVRAFHHAFDIPDPPEPTVREDEVVRHRLRLIFEEAFELLDASMDRRFCGKQVDDAREMIEWLLKETTEAPPYPCKVDLVEVADALADMDYVVEGTRLAFGIDGEPVMAEVHRTNMAKMGPGGKVVRTPEGKVSKPEGWKPPDIASVLIEQGWKPRGIVEPE